MQWARPTGAGLRFRPLSSCWPADRADPLVGPELWGRVQGELAEAGAELASLPSEADAEAAPGDLARPADWLADRLGTQDAAEAVRVQREPGPDVVATQAALDADTA